MPRQPVAGDPWFISHTRQGFTNMPEYALKTHDGHPIAAPGEGLKAARHVLKHKSALWEHLLDETEKMYELQDKFEELRSAEEFGRPDQLKAQEDHILQSARCGAIIRSLAILDYGVVDENSIALIEAQAVKRYNMSVGE